MTRTNTLSTLDTIAQAIYDRKGFNILAMDIREISSLTDYVVIAEGNVDRHVTAIAQSIEDALKETGITPMYVEGVRAGDWIVIDYIDITIHLFQPDFREKYALEELWRKGKIVDLNIELEKKTKA